MGFSGGNQGHQGNQSHDDNEEDDNEVENNNKDDDNNKDDNNYQGSSALEHDRDLGVSRRHQGHQWHQTHDDDDDDDQVEDNNKESDSLDVLAKTPGIYHVPELRYPYNFCCPC